MRGYVGKVGMLLLPTAFAMLVPILIQTAATRRGTRKTVTLTRRLAFPFLV